MGTHHQFYGIEKQLPIGSHKYQARNPKQVSDEIWNPTACLVFCHLFFICFSWFLNFLNFKFNNHPPLLYPYGWATLHRWAGYCRPLCWGLTGCTRESWRWRPPGWGPAPSACRCPSQRNAARARSPASPAGSSGPQTYCYPLHVRNSHRFRRCTGKNKIHHVKLRNLDRFGVYEFGVLQDI